MNWADWLIDIGILRVMDIHWNYQNLFWAGIVWHRLSANQIVRCFKLKKLKSYMSYQVDFWLPLKLQKISNLFGLCWKILLVNQFPGFFAFDLFDLLILILGVHCCIVLDFQIFEILWQSFGNSFAKKFVMFWALFKWSITHILLVPLNCDLLPLLLAKEFQFVILIKRTTFYITCTCTVEE